MSKEVEIQIHELEGKLKELRAAQVAELKQRLVEAKGVVRNLEQQIGELSGRPRSNKRQRTSSTEVRDKIHSVLRHAKSGLTQKEISERSRINYQTVVVFLRRNDRELKSSGSRKSKRYFLKSPSR